MLTNTRDAFGGQSRSPNMVLFDVLGRPYGFLLVCYSNFVREIFDFKNVMTLKTGLGVRRGHSKCHHATERIGLPIDII